MITIVKYFAKQFTPYYWDTCFAIPVGENHTLILLWSRL